MRTLLPLLAAAVFSITANAQTAASKPAHPHATMQQRFEQANVTHDGHLTLDQANAGYKSIARHFAAIDQDKKGYITEDDIRAFSKTQRALHHQSAATHHTANGQVGS
jgi:hypothetical protein